MASVDPNLGLSYGWTLGESGWHEGMDSNLKRLGAVVGLSVKDRDLATPPGSPADGERYLVPASASGAWAGKTGQIAVRLGEQRSRRENERQEKSNRYFVWSSGHAF